MNTRRATPKSRAAPHRAELAAHAPDHVAVMADVFGMLGDAGRLRLLLALREAPELNVSDLTESTGMTQSSVSHALRLLRAYRVVGVRREGRNAFYSITDDHVRLLLDATLEHLREHQALSDVHTRHAG